MSHLGASISRLDPWKTTLSTESDSSPDSFPNDFDILANSPHPSEKYSPQSHFSKGCQGSTDRSNDFVPIGNSRSGEKLLDVADDAKVQRSKAR
jgi:hypothetical protein